MDDRRRSEKICNRSSHIDITAGLGCRRHLDRDGAAKSGKDAGRISNGFEPVAFEHLFAPVVERAADLVWSGVDRRAFDNLTESAHAGLRHSLLRELSNLCAPALYEQFANARKTGEVATKAKIREPHFTTDSPTT